MEMRHPIMTQRVKECKVSSYVVRSRCLFELDQAEVPSII